MGMPNVNEIMTAWLLEHGYDGLFCDGCECMIPTDAGEFRLFEFCEQRRYYNPSPHSLCEPGYRVPSDDSESDYGWTIVPDKPGG